MILLQRLLPAWPAAVVWIGWVLPMLAWQEPDLRQQDVMKLPWLFRALLWLTVHVWPYSVINRLARIWQLQVAHAERAICEESEQKTLLTPVGSVTWCPSRLPSRLDLGLTPRSVAEAEAWFSRQSSECLRCLHRHGGGRCWACFCDDETFVTSVGS